MFEFERTILTCLISRNLRYPLRTDGQTDGRTDPTHRKTTFNENSIEVPNRLRLLNQNKAAYLINNCPA